MARIPSLGVPMIVAYTKIDIMPRENIPADMAKFADSGIDLDVFPVSARKGTNIRKLEEFLVSRMPEGGKVFEQDIVSDRSERFMIAEIMRAHPEAAEYGAVLEKSRYNLLRHSIRNLMRLPFHDRSAGLDMALSYWNDAMVIPKDAECPGLANEFINYILNSSST